MNNSFPLIPNQNTYYVQDKLLYINSEDRNIIKYPNPSTFEILLPTDIVNVATIQLKNWMIPTVFDTFSAKNNNLQLEFTVNNVTVGKAFTNTTFSEIPKPSDINYKFIITISPGNYGPQELANEIQNRMNVAVSNYLQDEYTFFKIIWNTVTRKFLFVNTVHSFELNNDSLLYDAQNLIGDIFNPCSNEKLYHSFSYYGLPAYLGFKPILETSTICTDKNELIMMYNSFGGLPQLSFDQNFYTGVDSSGNSKDIYTNINFIIPKFSYTLLRTPEIFLDIQTFNCVDETKPYTNNRFTQTTNQGNGSMNSFLGKIPMIATSNSFSSSNGGGDYQAKTNFNPPLEKVRKFIIAMRNHDGGLVDFGFNNWSITLNLESYIPTQNVKIIKTPF